MGPLEARWYFVVGTARSRREVARVFQEGAEALRVMAAQYQSKEAAA
jgi:hypothetical protein